MSAEREARSLGYRLTMVAHRATVALLVVAIVWATVTEGPNVGWTLYILGCAGVVEASWRVTRSHIGAGS